MSGLILIEHLVSLFNVSDIATIRSNSSSDSMFIERISSFIASSSSSEDLATPEKTIFFGSAPASIQRFNSFPKLHQIQNLN